MRKLSIADNLWHIAGGAALATVVALWPSASAFFVVFAVSGLLREQAQRSELGWVGAFVESDGSVRWRKVIEGTSWGIGAGAAYWIIT